MPEVRLNGSVGRDVDVIVVGGGPAGAATAIVCAQAGLDCLLIDSDPAAGGRSPGETLHPGVDTVFRALGVVDAVAAAGFRRHEGHWVQWGGPPVFQAFGSDRDGPWRGYQAARDVFDPLLVDAAERAGAHIQRGCRALSVVTDPLCWNGSGRRVTGVVTTAGTVTARVVVDAGGRRHWLDRQLGRTVRRVSPPLIAAYGYIPQEIGDAPRLRAESDGWTWTAPITAGTSAWTQLTMNRSTRSWPPLPDGAAALPVQPPKGADVTWRCAQQAAGPGWYLVGDAATVVDPSASHGVLRALMSGTVAARAIIDCTTGQGSEERAAAGYSQWMRDWFNHDVIRMHRLYQIFASWPAELVS